MSNHEIMSRGFALLREPFAPWLLRHFQNIADYKFNDDWWYQGVVGTMQDVSPLAVDNLTNSTDFGDRCDSMDIQCCLRLVDAHWNYSFKQKWPNSARSWCKELNDYRNQLAHIGGTDFDQDDLERALDTMARVAELIDPETQAQLQAMLRKVRYGSDAGSMAGMATPAAAKAGKTGGIMQEVPMTGLTPWRMVIEPHPDVAQGRYKNAEFAADLSQVAKGEGAYEYRDPVEFFSRTYVTEGMKGLLVQALRRVGGKDGEPVIQLKTAFGGGKTHSMLALYHLLRGRTPAKTPNVKLVLDAAELDRAPLCRVAVLVGTALDPSRARRPINMPGITINTLWGEMAAQLAAEAGNPKLYDYVKEADKQGVSPGSDAIKELFDACGPCVVLIDELVAYAKKLYKKDGLPAGTFDNLITFVQEVTEAARKSQNSLVVASIPESNVEIGEEEGGRRALEAIEHTFGRMESIWKPVAANEGFEIVRRRLFLNCKDEEKRDQVCMAFSLMYQQNAGDFPTEAKEVDYLQRMKSCYPIHPEIFDRLYEDWATIERFQKTRGVLRLMAAVVHHLWMGNDAGLLIMPGSVSMDISNIRDELTRHVGDQWNAIVDHEVDGKDSVPMLKDKENVRFGKLMAARRVSRTIMLGSAPSARSQSVRGIEASRIRLGIVQPGENIAVFNDALATLQSSLTYLYTNPSADRFWYDTRPTLRKTMEDRASQQSNDSVEMEIVRRLKQIRKERPFARLHICPDSSLDVSDEQDVGLVILNCGAQHTPSAKEEQDKAIQAAARILEFRGNTPRSYRNMLAFIAPDMNTMSSLKEEVKRFLAWKSIREDSVDLNLDAAQNRETDNSLARSNQTVDARLQETYSWLLVPYIDRNADLKKIIWDCQSIRGGTDSIVVKAAKRMGGNDQLITSWAPSLLLMEMENLLWQDKDHRNIGELWKMMCSYCYLPRLSDYNVLQETIQRGLGSDEYFGYAEAVSEGRFVGLKLNQYVGMIDRNGYLVKLMAALKQKAAEVKPIEPVIEPPEPDRGHDTGNGGGFIDPVSPTPPTALEIHQPQNRHFHLVTTLDNTRVVKNLSTIMDEVINQIMQLNGSDVTITLNVEANIKNGTPAGTVRAVSENCRTLKVEDFGFED